MEQNLEQYKLLNFLNEPARINGVTVGEIISCLLPLFAGGYLFGSLIGMGIAIVSFINFRQFKKRIPDMSAQKYWYFPDLELFEDMPRVITKFLPKKLRADSIPSHIRKYQG